MQIKTWKKRYIYFNFCFDFHLNLELKFQVCVTEDSLVKLSHPSDSLLRVPSEVRQALQFCFNTETFKGRIYCQRIYRSLSRLIYETNWTKFFFHGGHFLLLIPKLFSSGLKRKFFSLQQNVWFIIDQK